MSSSVKPVLFVTVKKINPNVNGGVHHVPVASQKKTRALAYKVIPQQQPAIPLLTLTSKSPTIQTDRVRVSASEKENRPITGPRLVKTRSDVFSRDCLLKLQAAIRIEDEKDKKSKSEKVDKAFREHSKSDALRKTSSKHHTSRSRELQFSFPETMRMSQVSSAISQGRIKYYKGRKPEKMHPY